MLQPKRTKFRKMHKGRNRGLAQRGAKSASGEFGLKSSERGRLTARQIEAARRAMTRYVKRGGKFGLEFFLISQLPISLLRLGWVKVRAQLIFGLPKSSLVGLCSK